MSRSQLQDSDAPAAVPDKAMLATVMSYLKNKNLKETAEVLQKELSTLGGDSTRSLGPMQFSSVGQSGTEPTKYEESYTSNAPFSSTPTPTTLTAAYLKLATANADSASATTTTTSLHKASKQPIFALPSLKALPTSPIRLNDNFNQHERSDRDENDGSVGAASPRSHDDSERRVTSTSLTPPPTSATPPGSGDAIQTLKFKPLPFLVPIASSSPAATPTNNAAATTTPTKSLDKNPLWFQSTSTPITSIPSSLIGGAANGSNGGKPIFFPTVGDATGSGLILKSPPTSMPPSSLVGGTAIRPPASLMYQFMATGPQNCLPNPFLGNAAAATAGTVLTVLPSPPTTNIPTMNPPQPVFLVANQSLVKPSPAPQQEKEPAHEGHDVDMEPATGQAQYPSMVSSTVSSPPPPHPRTLASIPPAELTPQHLELKAFAEDFKTRRIRLGFTQGAVGTSLAEKGYNNFAQSTISRFEQMQLSPANAATIRVILEKWLLEAESPDTAPPPNQSDLPMMAGRKRKKRAVFTPQTKSTLDEFFAQNPRPNRQAIEAISQKLDLLPEEVRVWFCNKRQKSKSGSVSSPAAYDRESSSTTSSGVPSPTTSEGGQSQKRRSPSPPKTPFTIEELSKSSSNGNGGLVTSPMHLATSSLLPLGGLVASVTQSMNQPLIFATSGGSPPVIFRGGAAGNKSPPLVLPPQFLATSPIVTDQSLN